MSLCPSCGTDFHRAPSLRATYCSRACADARFGPKYIVNPVNQCWEWQLTLNNKGYGVTGASKRGGSPRLAHRVFYERRFGPIPDGLWVLHRCDNPPCVNPDHLFLGTRSDNMKDAAQKGRLSPAQLGNLRPGVPGQPSPKRRLSHAQVRMIRTAHRHGETMLSIAHRLGINTGTVSFIVRGISYRDVSS